MGRKERGIGRGDRENGKMGFNTEAQRHGGAEKVAGAGRVRGPPGRKKPRRRGVSKAVAGAGGLPVPLKD